MPEDVRVGKGRQVPSYAGEPLLRAFQGILQSFLQMEGDHLDFGGFPGLLSGHSNGGHQGISLLPGLAREWKGIGLGPPVHFHDSGLPVGPAPQVEPAAVAAGQVVRWVTGLGSREYVTGVQRGGEGESAQ